MSQAARDDAEVSVVQHRGNTFSLAEIRTAVGVVWRMVTHPQTRRSSASA